MSARTVKLLNQAVSSKLCIARKNPTSLHSNRPILSADKIARFCQPR